jgi:eukaryotic-like serine/threonine-protein kinase
VSYEEQSRVAGSAERLDLGDDEATRTTMTMEWHPDTTPGVIDPLAALGVRCGEIIGGTYRIDCVLGIGGMGVVTLAFDEKLRRWVAIKFVNPSVFILPEMHKLFVDEARGMARLSHPNVLAVHALGEHGDTPYFVMEYVQGRTAAEWLSDRPRGTLPSPDDVVRLVEQACLGVEAIHASRTVHRDLKPSNLLIDHEFRVAVGDFGLSCLAGPPSSKTVPVGTAAYMAPETAFGELTPFEFARDIYALGCIAYEMFVGRPPFVGETAMNVLTKHIIESPVLPSGRRPELGTAYDDVIMKALAKDVADRYPTAGAFREALVSAHRGTADPERILVADDDPDWRDLIVSFLRRRFPHAVVDSAADGVAAMNAFCDRPYSVVLLDLEMPEMDGTKLTLGLRAIDSALRTAIVVLTAAGGPSEWRRLSAVGADAFLVKPVDLDDLELVIRRTLRVRRQTQISLEARA